MSKWEKKKWSEVLEIINGKSHKNVMDEYGEYPIYGSGGIMGYAKDYLCKENTVIIGRKGNINKPIFVEEKLWNVDTAFGLKTNEKLLIPKFLYYFCVHYNFEKLNTTVTIPSLTKANLLHVEIPLPPLEIQQQIAQTLDAAAELIALRKQQLAELDNLIKCVFYEMFGDPVVNEKGWDFVFTHDVYDIIDGDRGIYYPTQNDFSEQGYCVFLNTGNVAKEGFNFDKVKFISAEKDKQLRKGRLQRGDIILTTRGTVGNIAYYGNNISFSVIRINSGMVILRNINSAITPKYFCELFKSKEMKRKINSFLSGTAQPQLPITNLKKISLPLPPLSLQNQFAAIVTKIEEQKALVQQAIDESQYLFDCLMSKYFD